MDGSNAVAPGKEGASIKAIWGAQWRCRRSRIGTVLNALFTICPRARYSRLMAIFALIAAAVLPASAVLPPQSPRGAITQATASVRILSGERIGADSLPQTAIVRDTQVRGSDGSEKPARLVEFP